MKHTQAKNECCQFRLPVSKTRPSLPHFEITVEHVNLAAADKFRLVPPSPFLLSAPHFYASLSFSLDTIALFKTCMSSRPDTQRLPPFPLYLAQCIEILILMAARQHLLIVFECGPPALKHSNRTLFQ